MGETMSKAILLIFIGLSLISCHSFGKTSNDQTISHKILYIESEVTDTAPNFDELNNILYKIAENIKDSGLLEQEDEKLKAKRVFQMISETLKNNSYSHRSTYPESLTEVFASDDRLFDCDTGSFIYLSVADLLNLPMSMVEVEVRGNPGERRFGDHNFIRWNLKNGEQVDWDVNGAYIRQGDIQTPQYGFGWSEDEVLGYVYFLRGMQWRKKNLYSNAIRDYRLSIKNFHRWAKARNNLAWLYSTIADVQTENTKKEALELALTVVDMHPSVNNRDTLACAYAMNGDFVKAIEVQKKVVEEDDSKSFEDRLEKFKNGVNCLGEN